MSDKCIICGKQIPKHRRNKDTCSEDCALRKMMAWNTFIRKHRNRIMEAAIDEYKSEKGI